MVPLDASTPQDLTVMARATRHKEREYMAISIRLVPLPGEHGTEEATQDLLRQTSGPTEQELAATVHRGLGRTGLRLHGVGDTKTEIQKRAVSLKQQRTAAGR